MFDDFFNKNKNGDENLLEKIEEYFNIFYIDVIESLCFGQTLDKPNKDTIETILKAITDKRLVSNKEELKNSSFNLRLIYRSLLIQIVFKNYNDNVIAHLKSWFNSASFIGKNELFKSGEEISILFQNCVYDQYVNQFSLMNHETQVAEINSLCNEIVDRKNEINHIFNEKKIIGKTFDVNFLLILSKIKFCINVLTKFSYSKESYNTICNIQKFSDFNEMMKSIVYYTMKDTSTKTNTLINYLLKDLIRKYGSSSIKYVLTNENLKWMTPLDIIGDNQSVTDRYVLMGDMYLRYRKAILTCFTVRNVTPLKEAMQVDENPIDIAPYICTGLYQNITLLYKNLNNLTTQIAEIFNPFIDEFYSKEKNLFKPLLQNDFTNAFKVNEQNWADIELVLLLVQIKYSIIFSKSDLIKPLCELIMKPKIIADKYLPTMPQDNLYDIKIALNKTNIETNRFYTCPNGHIYVIGNCGRAWIKSNCKTCGEEIGGESHKLVDTNRNIDEAIQDKTMKGYCITDDPSNASEIPSDIRLLNSNAFHLERFFINACMYLACGDHDENVDDVRASMAHEESNLKEFFWKHMKNELNTICKSLNLTLDEIIIILHSIANQFLLKNTTFNPVQFSSKENRQQWEDMFNKNYLVPILQSISQCLTDSNMAIREKNMKKTGEDENQSKMYFMAYELVTEDKTKAIFLYENEQFWKYRPNISFDLMVIEFLKINTNKLKYPVLNKFIELNYQLQLLINLSSMIRLVKFLISILNKSIFKHIARNKSLKEFIDSIILPREWSKNEIECCVKSFQAVWSHAKQRINDYVRNNISNDLNLTVSFNHKYDMNTKLSYFLPTVNGDGLLCHALIHNLSKLQNEMLENYHLIKKIKNVEVKQVELFDNKEFLINFDKNGDLLRLIQSNFSYDSKNLQFIFRYENIEHQIIDKYLRSKPKVNLTSLPYFEYSDEISDFSVFKRLNEEIKQQSVDIGLQIEIMDEFKKISELSEALNTLKIVINYSIATSAQSNEYISSFIRKIYADNLVKQSEHILKTKIIENCKLENLKVIWILLMMKRSILYTLSDQDPFDNLKDCFKHDLSIKLALDVDRASICSITAIIYQIITFVLVSLEGEDLQSYSQIKIRDIFDSLEDLNSLVLLDKYKIPYSFLNDQQFSDDDPIKMDCIYSIWKQICDKWNTN